MLPILEACHYSHLGGHHGGMQTTSKVSKCGFYWLIIHQDTHDLVKRCNQCQHHRGMSRRHELRLTPILEMALFDVWRINFMCPIIDSYGNTYILITVDYMSKCVKAVSLSNNKGKSVTISLKKYIFSRFGTRALISDGGSHFCNRLFSTFLSNYGVKYKVAISYHPQTSGQVEVSNWEFKSMLYKGGEC